MKTTSLALAAALSLASFACAAPAEEATGSAGDAVSAPPDSVAVHTSELGAPHCDVRMGWWLTFEYQARQFSAYGGDDIGTCNDRLASLLSEPVRPAMLTKTGSTWKLDLDGVTFTAARLATAADDPTLLASGPKAFDLRFDISDLRCEILKGSFIRFEHRGHTFMAYGADGFGDCETRLARFRAQAERQGTLARMETVSTVKWTLTLDSEWSFTSFEALETSRPLVVDDIQVGNVDCVRLHGLYLEIGFEGRKWISLPPAGVTNQCEAVESAFRAQAVHTGRRVVRKIDGGKAHLLFLDREGVEDAWQFRAWGVSE